MKILISDGTDIYSCRIVCKRVGRHDKIHAFIGISHRPSILEFLVLGDKSILVCDRKTFIWVIVSVFFSRRICYFRKLTLFPRVSLCVAIYGLVGPFLKIHALMKGDKAVERLEKMPDFFLFFMGWQGNWGFKYD